jgi:NAD+ synthase (glutamine-hydrolysing)
VLAYVNQVGGQDELVFDGASLVVDANGEVIASAPQFEEDLLIVDVDVRPVFRKRLLDPRGRATAPALPTVLVTQSSRATSPEVPARMASVLTPTTT